jgi:hypothetical protein
MGGRSPIYITSSGYDPEAGLFIKDPFLGGQTPTLGACRPDLRQKLRPDDYLFVISGKVPGIDQFIIGGFQVAECMTMLEAYKKFPELRIHLRDDGQLSGNVVIDAYGRQHQLDHHDASTFDRRIASPYIVGKNPIVLDAPQEIEQARSGTMTILSRLFGKQGLIPRDVIGRMSKMDDEQVQVLLQWLKAIKTKEVRVFRKGAGARAPSQPLLSVAP